MPMKYYRKRRAYRKKRTPSGRRMRRMGGGIRSAARSLYSYKQIVLNPTTIGPVSVPAGGPTFLQAVNFQLSQAGGNVGPFTSLYDQYKISKVVWQLIPKFNSSEVSQGTTSGGNLPMIATCLDFDDGNTPAAFGDIIQRQNAKLHRGGNIITRVLKPCANFVVDAAIGALSNKASPWLDITNISVPHYGIKLGITSTQVDMDFEVVVKYYLQFRQVR